MMMSVAFTGCASDKKEESQATQSTETSTESVKEIDPEHLTGEDLAKLSNNFSLYIGIDETVDFNGFGQVVRADQVRYEAVHDLITDEVCYYSASYSDFVKNKEGGYDRKVYSRLYDTEGNILIDWENTVYGQAFGDWIVSRDYFDVNIDTAGMEFHAELLNTETEEKIKDVWSLEKLDEHHIAASGFMTGMLGIIDENGKKLAGFPWELEDGSDDCMVVGNYLVSYKHNEEDFTYDLNVYDTELCLLGSLGNASDSSLYDDGMIGPYLSLGGNVYDMSKEDGDELKPFLEADEVTYVDDEIAVMSGDAEGTYVLKDWNKQKVLSDSYQKIVRANEDTDVANQDKAEYFIGIDSKGFYKLDRNGKVVASANMENVGNVSALKSGFVAITDDWEHAALYDLNLKEVIPADRYTDIGIVYDDEKDPKNSLYNCGFYMDEEHMRMDLVKGDGTVVVKNASGIGLAKDGRIALSRGQSVGLIDFDGNWITKMKKYELGNMD